MKQYFLDSNVLLDHLLHRVPFGEEAFHLFEAKAFGRAMLYASNLSFSHIYYILRKTNSPSERLAKLLGLAKLVEIIPVDRAVIEVALTLGFADFEDASQYGAARAVPAIEAIVTCDPKGFAAGTLLVLSPTEAIKLLS